MKPLLNKRILLGISGGIAAYKSADLVRKLIRDGAEVRVIMTANACEFITPLTIQALSGHPAYTDLLDETAEAAMSHIELARWADVILIAPASANTLAKLVQGQANDLLTTVCLASAAKLMLAPAMNQQMWKNSATAQNIEGLKQKGIKILGPAAGTQACGDVGLGRMLEPETLLTLVIRHFQSDILNNTRIMLTAGPTREAIDPVRYISNHSSGKMGYALAQSAIEAGATVDLVSGPVRLATPERVTMYKVESAKQMLHAVMDNIANVDIFIAVAAVADYCISAPAEHKMKKSKQKMVLELEKTTDIVSSVAALDKPPFTIGFAAETDNLATYAQEKLHNKKLDMIIANQVGNNQGFNSEDNAVQVFWPGGESSFDLRSKASLAQDLIKLIADRYACVK